jgi:DNA invertase Pin-like site-specific DNA recombinase
LGADLFLHLQGVDTTMPAGKELFQMMGVFAEFEGMISERVKSGFERAKAQGKVLGGPTVDAGKKAAVIAELRLGRAGISKLAGAHAVGVGTVQRIAKEARAMTDCQPPGMSALPQTHQL